MDCPARGQIDEGNIRIHSRKRARYRCCVCGKTFSQRAGTLFFRRRTDEETISRVLTLIGNGCPIPAIEAAFGLNTCKPTRYASRPRPGSCGWPWH
jgi:transposase-like protein